MGVKVPGATEGEGARFSSPLFREGASPELVAQADQTGRRTIPRLESGNQALTERIVALEKRERELVICCSEMLRHLPLTMELYGAHPTMQKLLGLLPESDVTSSLTNSVRGSVIAVTRMKQELKEAESTLKSLQECMQHVQEEIDPAKLPDLSRLKAALPCLKEALVQLERTQQTLSDPVAWELRRLSIECEKGPLYEHAEEYEFIRTHLQTLNENWEFLKRETARLKSLCLMGTSVQLRIPLGALHEEFAKIAQELAKRASEFTGSTGEEPLSPRNQALTGLKVRKVECDARHTPLKNAYLSTFDDLTLPAHTSLRESLQILWENCNKQALQCQVLIEKIQKEQEELQPAHRLVKEVYALEKTLKDPPSDLATIRLHEASIKSLMKKFAELPPKCAQQDLLQLARTKIQGGLFRASLQIKQLELKWAQQQVTERLQTLSPAHAEMERTMLGVISSSEITQQASQAILQVRERVKALVQDSPSFLPPFTEMMRKIATELTLKENYFEGEMKALDIDMLLAMSLKADINSHHAQLKREATVFVANLRRMLKVTWDLEDYSAIYDCLIVPSQDISARLTVAAKFQEKIQTFIRGINSDADVEKAIQLLSEHVSFEQGRHQVVELYKRLTESLAIPWSESKLADRREFLAEMHVFETQSDILTGCSSSVMSCQEKCKNLFEDNSKALNDKAEDLNILMSIVSAFASKRTHTSSPSLPRRPSGL